MTLIDSAILILGYLNERTGSRFSPRNRLGKVTAMAEFVMARLKEGYTVDDYRRVIDHKCKEWLNDDRMKKYLNPETLSRRSNFERYLAECEEAKSVQDLAVSTEPGQVDVVKPADPERIREALAKGWQILRGKNAA